MADQTTLPTCTVGSLGGPKLDRRTAIDPKKDDSAAEIMLRNACIAELFRRMGLSAGAAAGSVEARLADLEAAGAGALDLFNPQLHFRAEDFDTWTALSSPGWDNGGGVDPWTVNTDELRAGLSAAFADECLMKTAAIYLVDYEVEVRFIVRVDAWDSSVGSCFVCALYDNENNYIVAGVRIWDYGTEGVPPQLNRRIEGIVGDNFGTVSSTDLGAFANDTSYEIRWRVDLISPGVVKLYVSVNGAAEVDCGTPDPPIAPGCYLSIVAPHVDAGTGTFYLNQLRRKANWDPDLDP
jgi:hypothetical protein